MELGPKRLELLHELLPKAETIAALINPTFPGNEIQARELQTAASTLGLQVHVLHASTDQDITTAFANVDRLQANGLVIGNDPFFSSRIEQLAALALRHAVPAVYGYREFATANGLLMSYGTDLAANYRLAGIYIGKILKGDKPADLPVVQSTKVELIINLKTANALGITIPPSIMVRADEVIE
jgi:putative ABC transport system substrate-binding protein